MPHVTPFCRLLLPLLAVAVAACTPARNDMNQMPAAEESAQQDAAPRRKLNPTPRQAYRITLTIDNAPGSFASVEGVAQYEVENQSECGRINPSTGTTYRMPSLELFALEKKSDNQYQGLIYTDLLLDEDYFGRGVCRWKFVGVQAQLKATGAEVETRFLPQMKAEQVLGQKSVITHFRKVIYPRDEVIDNFPNLGQVDRSKFAPHIQDDDLFSIALGATEAQP